MKPENKIRIKKLLSEGAVIVFAILLAFLIDAWWAQRLLAIEEAATLKALETEFSANLEQVERVSAVYRRTRQRMTDLGKLSDEQVHELSQAEVSDYTFSMCVPWSFDPMLGTTNALISAGKLGILSDPELRAALSQFVNLAADANNELRYLETFALQIWGAQIAHGGPWTDPSVEEGVEGEVRGLDFIPKATSGDLVNMRADRNVMGLVKNFHLSAAYYETDLGSVRKEIQHILELVRKAS